MYMCSISSNIDIYIFFVTKSQNFSAINLYLKCHHNAVSEINSVVL